MNKHSKTWLFFGAFCIAFAPILVKAVDLHPIEIALYRCGLAALFLAPLGIPQWLARRHELTPRYYLWLLGAGLFFALDLSAWHVAVQGAGAGMGTILANTQVFYLTLLGALFYRESLPRKFLWAVVFGFLGVYLLVQTGAPQERQDGYYVAVGLGILTGLLYSSFLVCLRQAGKMGQTPAALKIFLVTTVSSVFLIGMLALRGESHWPDGMEWVWMGLLALVPQVLGWLVIADHLPKVPISVSALILLGQPALATLLGALIYGETMAGSQALGAVLTLGAIYLGSLR